MGSIAFEEGLSFLLDVQWGRVVLGLLGVGLLFVLRGAVARLTARLLRRAGAGLAHDGGARLGEALQGSVRMLLPLAGLALLLELTTLPQGVEWVAERILLSLLVFAIFRFLHKIVDLVVDFVLAAVRGRIGGAVDLWVGRSLRILSALVGGATVLELWGVAVTPILAGLGIGGVALALGAQDLCRNLIGGAAILLERRFGLGDWIAAEGVVEGTVERIGYRSTLVRKFDLSAAHVPNSRLSDAAVVNYATMTNRRIYWQISLTYSTSVAQLREIRDGIEAYIIGHEDFESPEKISTFVRIDRFNDSSIDLLIYCFTKTTSWGEWLGIKEALLYRIKEIVEGAGSDFAFPSRSLYVESLPHGTPAQFAHPGGTDDGMNTSDMETSHE